MKPIETSADQFISCPIYASKNPDFPIRVTQRAIERMTNLKYPYGDLVPSHYELEK